MSEKDELYRDPPASPLGDPPTEPCPACAPLVAELRAALATVRLELGVAEDRARAAAAELRAVRARAGWRS